MFTSLLFVTILVGEFGGGFMSYSPLLTYMVRYNKITSAANVSGNYTISQYGDVQYINGHLTIKSEKTVTKIQLTFYRCKPEGFDCEYFQSWILADLCSALEQKNQLWSSLCDNVDPPFRCPINKMYYKLNNVSIDIDPISRWYPDCVNYQWKVTLKYFAEDTYLGSLTIEASIFGYRKRTVKTKPLVIG